jgi:hypothetical protein
MNRDPFSIKNKEINNIREWMDMNYHRFITLTPKKRFVNNSSIGFMIHYINQHTFWKKLETETDNQHIDRTIDLKHKFVKSIWHDECFMELYEIIQKLDKDDK